MLVALSPVLEPDTDTAPAPMVRTEVLATLPVKVTVPVLTVRAVVRVALVTVAELPSILVIPVKTKAAEALFRATAVVPIYIVLELAALSPVLVPETVASAAIVRVLLASFNVRVSVLELIVRFSVLASTRSKAPVPVERIPREVRASAVPPLISGVVKTGLARVPTVVREEVTTVALRVVPVKVPAGAITTAVETAVINPFPLTVKTGIAVEEPKEPMFRLTVAKVVALPTEVTSPVKLALVVTVPAVSPAAVPVMLVPTKAEGVPRSGVINVGEVAKTNNPEPVSSLITPANSAEVVAERAESLFEV